MNKYQMIEAWMEEHGDKLPDWVFENQPGVDVYHEVTTGHFKGICNENSCPICQVERDINKEAKVSKAPESNNNNKEKKMNDIFRIAGDYDRDALRTRPDGRYITVEAFEDSANQEVGVFMESIIGTGMLTRAIHVSLHKDVIDQGAVEFPQRPTDLYLCNNSSIQPDGVVQSAGTGFNMVPNMDFTLVTFTDEGVVDKELHLNTDEVELAMWWPSKETGVDTVFVPKGERGIFNDLVMAGPDDKPVTLARAKFFINKLHEIPIVFGSVEQVIRFFTSSLEMHPAEMLHLSKAFGINVFQIKSEEMIDMAVQSDKAFKRLSSLFRVGTPINEIVDEVWTFHMVKAFDPEKMELADFELDPAFAEIEALRLDWEEEFNMDTLHMMNILHHDGCVYVNPAYLNKMEKMIDSRYKRLDFSNLKRLAAKSKFRKALTFQLRATGAGLVDQHGEVLGHKGHMKTHIMVASGAVARWMKENDIAFFGTDESYKKDMAVRTDKLALLVQTKAPKFDIVQSVQFYTTFNGIAQGAQYNVPLRDALKRALDKIVGLDADGLQEFADAMAGEAEDDEDMEELGDIRKGANEMLATYGRSGLPVIDSPAATFGVLNNMLQRFRFATLNEEKNIDMSNKGFGRHIAFPIPGVRLQVFPRSFMVAGGHDMPVIEDDEIFFYGMDEMIQVAVVSDQAWYTVYEVTGGPDLDDFWEAMVYTNMGGECRIKLQRNPAMWGEYMLFYPHLDSFEMLEDQVITPYDGALPVIDEDLLPTRVDEIETLTLAEAYDKFIAPATGRLPFDMLDEVEKLDEQKRLMLTYVQMIILSGARLLNEAHLTGLETGEYVKYWKRMDSRMLAQPDPAELRQYNKDMKDWNEIGRQMGEPKPMKPRGVIEGLIAGPIKSINNKPDDDKYVDVHALIDFSNGNPWPAIPGEEKGHVKPYGPYIATEVLVPAALKQVGATKIDKDDDGKIVNPATGQRVPRSHLFEGGITTMRNMLEKRLENAFRLVLERIYDDYGIKLDTTNEPGKRYYNTQKATSSSNITTSQHRLRRMQWTKGFDRLFGEKQAWMKIRAHEGRWVEDSTDTRIKVVGLDQSDLGQVALYTSVSQYLPAASMVRALYSKYYRDATFRKDLDRPAETMASREAWLQALEDVQIPMSSEDDLSKFVLALLYVLRATPNVARIDGRFNVDVNLAKGYGRPINVQAEGFLYSSILINWGSRRKNLVLTAFEHMKDLLYGTADPGEAREVELVTYRGSDLMVDVFLFKPETELTCVNCGKTVPVAHDKFVKAWTLFNENNGFCKDCR